MNNDSCTNNLISGGRFWDNAQGGLSQAPANPVVVRVLVEGGAPPVCKD